MLAAGAGVVRWARGGTSALRGITSATVRWRGVELGGLAALTPPVRFGFASAPARPSLTALTSYVRES